MKKPYKTPRKCYEKAPVRRETFDEALDRLRDELPHEMAWDRMLRRIHGEKHVPREHVLTMTYASGVTRWDT